MGVITVFICESAFTPSRLVPIAETAVDWSNICLLEFIEPVLVRTVLPIALQYRAQDVERFSRHLLGAGYYHHKRAAVMAMAAHIAHRIGTDAVAGCAGGEVPVGKRARHAGAGIGRCQLPPVLPGYLARW